MFSRKTKNIALTILLVFTTTVFVLAATPEPAQAQWATISTTIGDIPRKIGDILTSMWKKSGSRAFQQAIRSVSYKLAQDTATFVASGGKGQKPLLFSDPGKFLRDAGDQVAGDFLVKLTDGFPIDLCSADNIKSKLAINIGINKSLMNRRYAALDLGKPGCKLSAIKNNFAEAAQAKNFLVNVSTTFEPGKNDISSGVALFEDAKKAQDKFIAAELARRIQSGDIDGFTDLVTKYPNTPRELVEEAQREAARQALAKPPRTEDIFIDTFAVFTNTLVKTYLQKLAGGYYPFKKISGGPDSADLAGTVGSIKALLASFNVFSPQRAAIINTTGEIDLFSDMISCPPPQYQSPYNCLLNDGLQQAIQQGLTVKQTLDKGLLDGNMTFPQVHDPNKPTLSLPNLRKLRFLRVLPVGWELAAEKLQKSKVTTSLRAVVECFNGQLINCSLGEAEEGKVRDNIIGLVDPKWVLTLPQQYCRAEGVGNVPESERAPGRRSWCVDLQSCIKDDGQGNCQAYGYCTRERAVWQLQGEQCQPQYSTCQVLRRSDGTTIGSPATPGILGSDVDERGCTQTNAGCTWFSTNDSEKSWQADKRIYLTNLAPSCRAEDAGSREIIPLQPGTNLIRTSAATETVSIKPYAYYTLSFNVDGAAALTATVTGGASINNVSFGSGAGNSLKLTIPNGSSSRYAATFFSRGADNVAIAFSNQSFSRVQLEEVGLSDGQRAQAAVAANSGAGLAVLNVSPPGARNPASPATAYKEYKDNRKLVFAGARTCDPEESSARKYTPLAGGEAKVARLLAGDLCPAACAGLDSYLAMPTWLETAGATPTPVPARQSFIAQYAKACSAAEVGCEEFTNITTQGGGAERREYYSQVRSCVLDTNPNAATFYTWEGTDTAGFQLKAWQLLKDVAGAPCNNFTRASSENPSSAACAGVVPDCSLDERNPDCRVFLDENGRESKRDVTKVVSAASECAGYRRSRDGQTWYFLTAESKQCTAVNVGCREYKGARANVAERLLFSNFENTNHGWTQLNGRAAALSGESVVAGKYSLRLDNTAAKIITANIRNTANNTFLISFLAKKSGSANLSSIALYEGSPDADFNGDGQIDLADFQDFADAFEQPAVGRYARYDINRNNVVDFPDFFEFAQSFGSSARRQDFNLAGLKLTDDWQEYRLGPVEFNINDRALVYILKFESPGPVFVDNIELLASPTQFFITDFWQAKQPASCSAYNRCDAYRDDNNNTFYAARFDKLFSDDSAYCRAVIDTQNSNSPGAESFNQGTAGDNPTPTYAVAADNLEYRVIKPENLRPATAAGCTALGVPDEGASPPWKDPTYRVVDPDMFKQGSLCQAEGLGCQNFQNEQGESFVFRDPGKKLCAWDSTVSNGAFVQLDANGQNTRTPCYNSRTTDPATWFVAQCPAEQSSCTAYAPTDANLTEGASSALFMRADTVEPGSCKAGDGIDSGCVNFKEGYVSAPDIRKDLLATSQDRLLSVKATRQCAEWLAPTTVSEVNDLKSRSVRTIIYDLGRCQELGANGRCVRWTDQAQASFPAAYKDKPSGAITKLQPNVYSDRFAGGRTLFSGVWDYSGYSIPNQYPVELLQESAMDLACRSFPEEDAPFASDKLDFDTRTGKFLYNDATRYLESLNKCEPGETCQCTYKKVTTTDGTTKYYNTNTLRPFPDDMQSIADLTGWPGYCAEWDEETKDPNGQAACLAWWPVDVVKNGINIFDNHPEAGFTAGGPQYYCLQARGNKLSGNGLVPFKTEKNSYFIRVNDFASNFEKAGDVYPLWKPVNKGHGFWGGVIGFALGGIPGIVVGGVAGSLWTDKIPAGWEGNSGLKQFKVQEINNPASTLPLTKLREYDIESIVLTVDDREADDWPSANEEIILRREGFAKSKFASPETEDRWSAFWCGGSAKDEPKCDFNGIYSWDKFMPFILDGSTTCNAAHIGSTNILAMRARFADANGKADNWGDGYEPYQFLGIEGGLCDSTKEKGWMIMGINLQLREWCTTVAAVNQGSENKAWTGRLNQKSVTSDRASGLYNAEIEPEQLTIKNGVGVDYKYNQDKAPFGAMVPPGPTIYLPEQWDSRKDEEAPDEAAGQKEIKILEPGKQPLYVEVDRKQVRAGSPYSCPGSDQCVIPPADKGATLKQEPSDNKVSGLERAAKYLQQLFAKIYGIWQWETGRAGYQENAGYKENNDLLADNRDLITKTKGWKGQCPVIQSAVMFRDKYEKNITGEGDCQQDSYWGHYSINGQAIINTKHVLSDEPITVNIGEETILQFYAYNENGEQLPLRKIEIDWNDGIRTSIAGSFKNHKQTCDNSSPNYGNTSKACDSNIFEFKHVYTRPGSFTPALRVWDNWGRFTIASYRAPSTDPTLGVIKVQTKTVYGFPAELLSGIDAQETVIPAESSAFGWEAKWRNTDKTAPTKLQTLAQLEARQPGGDYLYPVIRTVARDEREINYAQHSGRDGLPDGVGTRGGEWFGVTWTGALKIDVTGDYRFKLISDDGSDFFIAGYSGSYSFDGAKLLELKNEGDHGSKTVESAPINLYQGNHAARVRFYNNTRGWGVKLEWKKPGSSFYEVIPLANMLSLGTRLDPPPIPGGWSNWSTCTASCGGGTEERNCNNPAPTNNGEQCLKEDGSRGLTETKNCNTQPCPVPVAGGWSNWENCSVVCGGGTRSRSCTNPAPQNGGQQCLKEDGSRGLSETKSCNTQPCPPPYDFSLSNSGNVTVAPGGSGTVTITVRRVSGTVPEISLQANVSGPNSGGITGLLNPNRCTPNPSCLVSFNMSVSQSTPAGSRPVITVSAGSKTTSFTIIVP